MIRLLHPLLLLGLLASPILAQEAAPSRGEKAAAPVLEAVREALAAEARLSPATTAREKLERMGVLDQAGRAKINLVPWASLSPEQALAARKAIAAALEPVDEGNAKEFRKLLPKEGWFSRKEYGDRATAAAFHILQHSRDVETKRRVLPYMEALALRGEIEGADYASMFDRMATSQGRPQRYGTQFRCVGGRIEPFPLEDPAAVERLRAPLKLRQTYAEAERIHRGRPCG